MALEFEGKEGQRHSVEGTASNSGDGKRRAEKGGASKREQLKLRLRRGMAMSCACVAREHGFEIWG